MRIASYTVATVCFAYWLLLTALLLTPNPVQIVGRCAAMRFPWGDTGIHFTALSVLTLLVHGMRWPHRPGWVMLGFLVAYGVAVEALQAFVPHRTVELKDFAENLLGVGFGSAVFWIARHTVRSRNLRAGLAAELVRSAGAARPTGE